MSEMKKFTLSDIGEIVTGSTPSTSIKMFWGGDIPFYSPADFNGNKYAISTERTVTDLGANTGRKIESGAIMVTCIGSIGKMAICSNEGITNQQINTIILKPGFDSFYVYYLILNSINKFINFAPQTTIPILNKTEFGKFNFYFHEYTEQQKIANILSAVDKLIENTQTLIDKYTTIKQGMMADLFTRGIDLSFGPDGTPASNPNYGQLRPSVEDAPELYQETLLGWVPKGWEVHLLGDIADVIDPQPDHRTPPESESGIPYVGVGDFFWDQKIDKAKCRKVIYAAYEKQKNRFQVEKGDIIFGKIGTIGQPKQLQETEGFALSANILLIRANEKNSFIFAFFESEHFNRQLNNIVNTTSQPALGIQTMRDIKVAYPVNQLEVIKIVEKVQGVEERIVKSRKELDKYKNMKKGLMQDLLTGKVRVN